MQHNDMNKEERSTDALDRLGKESGITLENSNRKAHGLNIHTLIPAKDALRLVYHGVFYDGGVAVKTDGRCRWRHIPATWLFSTDQQGEVRGGHKVRRDS